MPSRLMFCLCSLMTLLGLGACNGGDGDGGDGDASDGGGDLAWYLTCGDPACSGHAPQAGVDECTDEVVGATCSTAGGLCDPIDDCNAQLICAASDPRDQVGGCPISQRSAKRDIHYLSAAERDTLREHMMRLPLASFAYKGSPEGAPPRLGFIIDDVAPSPAVDAREQRVDLYGFISMAVATIQAQQAELEALTARLEALEGAGQAGEVSP